MFNTDESHFKVDLNDGKTLAMRGDEKIKFTDVVSGDDGMKMMVTLWGCPSSAILSPFMVFQNKDFNFTIQGIPDDVPDVSYRTGLPRWMDNRIFIEWLGERRALPSLP